jgi:type II secretory pathway pseudopilin PulG
MGLTQTGFNETCANDANDTSLILALRRQCGWTLIELIVVIGLVAFLSRIVINQISTGLEDKRLDATISNLGVYFSNASRMARASGEWTLVVVNTNRESPGFLRQLGTYRWFKGEEPGEASSFIDINGNGKHDKSGRNAQSSKQVEGWNIEDPKGFWLPEKIFFDLLLSGPAQFVPGSSEFRTFENYSPGKKFLHFAMKHKTSSNGGDDPVILIKRGRLPFFLDRSGQESDFKKGNSKIEGKGTSGVDSFLAREITFSKPSKDWIFFAFDRYGRYVNSKSGTVLGTGAPAQAQQDFIVLSQGFMDPDKMHRIRGKSNNGTPPHAAFLIHHTGSFTLSQDDFQIPKAQ